MKSSLYILIALLRLSSCQHRIVGGTEAQDGMFPYAAYLLVHNASGGCTGSLLTSEWVLTAAHCLGPADLKDPKLILITAGSANKESEAAQTRNAKTLIKHWNFTFGELGAFDIALIKVDKPFDLSAPNIGTISLSSETWPQENQLDVSCQAVGWGRTTEFNVPDVLQYLDVTAKHGEVACPCVQRYHQTMIVCVKEQLGKGPCMGDSGGPLVCNGKEVGIAHIGYSKKICDPQYKGDPPKMTCGGADAVVTYLYLCPQLDWIRKHIPSVPPTPASCGAIAPFSYRFDFIILLAVFAVFFTRKYI